MAISFDPATLILGLFISTIGYGYFSYGRKQAKVPMIVCGLAMMVYPYFVTYIPALLLIGVLLAVLPRFF